jgi:hypothetical protein
MDPAVVDVAFEERYWYPHDGGMVWVAGYQLVDPESGRYLARDAPAVVAAGLIVVNVAGAARHHADALAAEGVVAPGRPLTLRRDPDNAHDPNAIAVYAASGGAQLGNARLLQARLELNAVDDMRARAVERGRGRRARVDARASRGALLRALTRAALSASGRQARGWSTRGDSQG